MPYVEFTSNLRRHVECPPANVPGQTVREALDQMFSQNEQLRGYILDDQGSVRKHVMIFVNSLPLRDREKLSDATGEDCKIYVMQALSGG